MKIIFVFPTSQLGGAERIMFNLAKYLSSINFQVSIFILSSKKNHILDSFSEKNNNFDIFYCSACSDKNLFSYIYLVRLMRKYDFDYIFTSHIITNALVSFILKFTNLKSKLISRESTIPFERFSGYRMKIIQFMYKFFYGSQDILIFQTDFMKNSLINNLGYIPAKKCIVIPNCVDIDNIESQIIASDLAYNNEVLTFVACGRFIELKQFDVLIKAYSKLVRTYQGATKLILIGEGPMKNELRDLSEKLNMSNKIIFTGNIKNPAAYFSIADIGIVSSTIEGFPNVILEMMISGTKNIVSTPCTPAIRELPNILISDHCSEKDILDLLVRSENNREDNSLLYKKYIKEFRSIKSFWNKVEEEI